MSWRNKNDMFEIIQRLSLILTNKEKQRAWIVATLMLIGVCAEALSIGLILPFMTLILDPESARRFLSKSHFCDSFRLASHTEIIITACVLLLFIFVCKNLYLAFLSYFQNKFIFETQTALSRRLLAAYLSKPYEYHFSRNIAELQRNTTTLIPQVVQGLILSMFSFSSELLVSLAILTVLIVASPWSAIVVTLSLGFVSFGIYYFIRKKVELFGKKQNRYSAEMIKWVNQSIGSIKETKVMGREILFLDSFSDASRGYANSSLGYTMLQQTPKYLIEIMCIIGLVSLVVSGVQNDEQTISLVSIMSLFGVAAFRVMPSMNRIIASLAAMRFMKQSLDLVWEDLLDSKNEDAERALVQKNLCAEAICWGNGIELCNISYRYPESTIDIFSNVTLSIPKGTSVGFVGLSGAGKTTLVDLILGLLLPQTGRICVDGKDIHSNLRAWQNMIGYIPQEVYLIDDTIVRNIALGIPNSLIDEKRVWRSIKIAQLEETVKKMPDGIETIVGEQGIRLSGGQKQRIGIARAIYHDPEVLVLDEATSSLDQETEKSFIAAIDELSKEKTLLVIAHRLSTIEKCQMVYRINSGVVERVR